MRKYLVIIAILLVVISAFIYLKKRDTSLSNITDLPLKISQKITSSTVDKNSVNSPAVEILATGLDTPWSLVFLPDKSMLVTERKGTVRYVDQDGTLDPDPIATVSNSQEIGEGGLLGITIHPNFSSNNFVYLYYTYKNTGENTLNRVVRMTYTNKTLIDEKIIVDAIPGASNHNGGRIKFSPDNMLYITTGDAQEPSRAQNTTNTAGKILRVTDEGQPVPGNPFDNLIYSYGHRNVQGIAWDKNGNFFATEHGRSGALSGLDEINFIQAGKNYGWPDIQGNETRTGMETALRNSGSTTWAPAGMAYFNGSLFFGGLRGQTLYEAVIKDKQIAEVKEHFKGQFGRIREVIVGPDQMLYISTSNNDGRGNPSSEDDRIIRISTLQL